MHALSQLILVLALGIVSLLPRTSVAQHLRGLADLLRCRFEELRPGETLVLVFCAHGVDIVLESGVLGHGAECNQGVAESVLVTVVRRPVVLLRLEALCDCVGEVGVVLLCTAHVTSSTRGVVDGCIDACSHEVVLVLDVDYLWSVGKPWITSDWSCDLLIDTAGM